MFQSRQTNWIGFQEAQKTISNLKEEVEIAEKKLLDAKRSFIERTSKRKSFQAQVTSEENVETSQSTKSKQKESHPAITKVSKNISFPFKKVEIAEKKFRDAGRPFTKRKSFQTQVTSEEHVETSQSTKSKDKESHPAITKVSKNFSPCKKETFPVSSKSVHTDENKPAAVPREELSVSEEEPYLPPFKYPHIEPLDFKSTLIKSSFDNFLSSSEISFSSINVKHLSSEGTSSLIASTYKEAGNFLEKHETKVKSAIDVCKSLTSSTSGHEDLYETKKPNRTKNSHQTKSEDIGLEWKEISNNKAFFVQNKFKTDSIHKLRTIIEKQKKEQQLYLLKLEKDFSSNSDHPYPEKFPTAAVHQLLETTADDETIPVSVRKVCTVKSLPSYKGFSAPSKNLIATKRWRKQKNQYTIAKSTNIQIKGANARKRIKTVVKCDSQVVSTSSHQKKFEKAKQLENSEKSTSHIIENNYSNNVKDISEDDKSENNESCNDKPLSGNSNIVADIQSILKGNELSGKANSDDSIEDAKDITFSCDIEISPNDQSFLKENKKPMNKNVKRKAKKSLDQDQKVASTKMRHYDVEKIRDYMRKKKVERKKRHLEEHRKKMHEAQKKRESLEKLLEYQKQNTKTVAKVKPLSPIKIFQRKDSVAKTHENEYETNNSNRMEDNLIHKIIDIEERVLPVPDDRSKKKQELKRKEISVKNQINVNEPQIKKQENVHIDISIPKVIAVSATSVHQIKSVKDSPQLILSSETPVNNCETVTEAMHFNKSPTKSSKLGRKKNEVQDAEDINIDNEKSVIDKISDIFRSISSVSTPSEISHIIGADAKLIEEMNTVRQPLPEMKTKRDDELKNLIKSINVMTKPIEPLLRTKQWLDRNPFPPRPAKSRFTEVTNFSRQQQLIPDFQVGTSKSREPKDSSFKEQVSGIGDVSQLYAQILGRKSTFDAMQRTEKRPVFVEECDIFKTHQLEKTEDEIIEGSLESDVEYILDQTQRKNEIVSHVEASHTSSHFSDLLKANLVPDPFNFVNTWKRKPFGLTIHDGNVKTKGIDIPSKLSSNHVPFDEIYKSMLNMDSEAETKPLENNIPKASHNLLLSQETNSPLFVSFQQKKEHPISREETPREILSTVSNATVEDSETSSRSSAVTHEQLSRHLHIRKNISTEKASLKQTYTNKKGSTVKQISKFQSSKETISHAKLQKDKCLNEKILDIPSNDMSDIVLSGFINSEYSLENEGSSPENIPDVHFSTKSEMILPGAINSKCASEVEKSSHESIPDVYSNNRSEMLLSGSINSEYSLITESSKEDFEQIKKETVVDKASASGSSVSEVISVIENSKGFRSSAEDLQSSKTVSSKHSEVSNHNSVEGELNSKSSSRSSVEDIVKSQSNIFCSQELKNISSHSTKVVQNNSEDTAVLLKNDQFQNIPSIPSGSQTNITIDFRQPLRLTLSNGEPVQSNQGLNVHDSQYFHTQVITRVASEAAAAAAKSAVVAVFETQALLVEKNYSGIISAHGKSSSNKTHYSSDFESSPTVKSSSPSLHSIASRGKDSETVPEDISNGNNNKVSSKNGSVGENILSEFSNPDQKQLKSSQSSSMKTEVQSIHSEESDHKNYKTSQRSKRKISGNVSSPSPASLSDNESISTETLMSSQSNSSHVNESALSDDSFAQLTLDIVRRMTKEKEVRATHQLSILQYEEKNLVQKARSEMLYLELLKKKLKQKGAERKKEVSSIKKRQKELISRLRQERAQLQCMQKAYRRICEKPYSTLFEDKKKSLKGSSSLDSQLLIDEKPYISKYADSKLKESHKLKSSSVPTLASDNDEKTMGDDDSVCEVPEILKGLTSNSSQESVVETQASEPINTSSSSQNKSQRNSPNPPFSPFNAVHSNLNPSIHSNNSLETALQGLKKLEASKRHLTKREQRILQRRKQVESLLQWQKKLDNEERAVRELEQKALDLVDHSKKKAKYYVSSSGSTNQEDYKRKDSIYESLSPSAETPSQHDKLLENSPLDQSESKTPPKTSDESIPTNLSENDLEGIVSEKENAQASSSAHSDGSLPEEIKTGSEKSFIQTVEALENGLQPEEVVSEEISYQGSPSVKDKSSSSDIYSESFESTVSKKSPSVLSISSPFKNPSPSRNIKRDTGPGIRPPLVPRNLRRHDSSGSDDSYTISQSETASDQSDIEVRIHALAEELKRRKVEAEKLKREQKKRNRERLKEKELSLQKQLEACNQYIQQKNLELEQLSESSVSPPQISDVVVKPRIKWPRSEKVIDSRRIRKQTALTPDAFNLEKKTEFLNSSPETAENSVAVRKKDKVVRKLFPEHSLTNHEENTSKEILENLSADSKEVSEALSTNNSLEIQEVSEIDQSISVSTEVQSDKGTLKANENSTISSVIAQNDVQSSESEHKHSSRISYLDENKSIHDSADSKSQTDTFISESSSSKSSDLNGSKQSDDSTISNKTVSSDEEHNTKRVKDVSEDIIQKSVAQHSLKVAHESSSTEDSVSEVQSIINSSSPERDELDNGCSYKSSKCKGPGGCESSPKKQVIGLENEYEKLCIKSESKLDKKRISTASDIESSSVCQVQKKLFPSESEIVNIVNYMSTLLINDALHNLYTISNESSILSNFLNHQSHENKVLIDSLNMKEKVTETLTQSLFDAYLKDAFISLFSNLKNARTYSEKSMPSFFSSANIKCDSQSTPCTSSASIFNDNSIMVVENTNEFLVDQLTKGSNENETFTESANWSTDNLMVSEREQQIQLEQQLILQQYPYFYRKIPNKPPPPYTPPSSTTISLEFPFIKEKTVEKITTVKKVTKHIHDIMDYSIEVLLSGKQNGLIFSDISMPTENPVADKLELTLSHQSVYIDLVFDLTKEVILEHYSETKQIPRPWLRPRKLTPKPLIPSSTEVISKNIGKELKKALKINEDPLDANQKKQIFLSSLKLGRKKRDFVDTILISELKEEEPDWVNYDQDEITVKLQIADSILSVLLNDTMNVIKDLQLKVK